MSMVRPLHVGISTNDMEGSIRWYETNLDCHVIKDDYVPFLKARIVFVGNDSMQFELFKHDDWKPLPEERRHPDTDIQTLGTKHIAFETDDMQALKEKFKTNGVEFVIENQMGDSQVLYVRDNAGVLIEFIQNP